MLNTPFLSLFLTLLILIWVVLTIWAGYLGNQRQIGSATSVVLSMLLSFPISLIYILLSPKLSVKQKSRKEINGFGRLILSLLMLIALIIPIALMFVTNNEFIVVGSAQLSAGMIRLLGYFIHGV